MFIYLKNSVCMYLTNWENLRCELQFSGLRKEWGGYLIDVSMKCLQDYLQYAHIPNTHSDAFNNSSLICSIQSISIKSYFWQFQEKSIPARHLITLLLNQGPLSQRVIRFSRRMKKGRNCHKGDYLYQVHDHCSHDCSIHLVEV